MDEEIKVFLEGHKLEDVVLYALMQKLPGIKPFDPATYSSLALHTLVVCAMMALEKNGHELTHEHVLAASYICFRDKFSFQGMEFFADSIRIEKSLQRCNEKGYFIGKNSTNYILSDKGRKHAEQMFETYKGGMARSLPPIRLKRMEGLLKETVFSTAFQKYIAGALTEVTESDMCYVLQGTLSTPKDHLRLNLYSLKGVAEDLKRTDVIEFFTWLEKTFQHYIK